MINDNIMTDQLQLVMTQANPTVGAIQQNLEQILQLRRAHADADLIVLSECFLTGYPLQDLVGVPSFIKNTSQAIDELAASIKATPGPAVLFGAPTAGPDKPYNSAILIRADGSIAMTHKRELPNNDVFDELRTFAQGFGPAEPLRLNDGWNLGVMICEDSWHQTVAKDLQTNDADFLISINGSPCRLDKQQQRLEHMRNRVSETNLPLIYVNQVGSQDELVFDGASFALNDKGEVITQLAFMQGDTAQLTVKRNHNGVVMLAPSRAVPPIALVPSEEELMYRAGVLGLRDYADKNHILFAHLGISGGADSALVAMIAADALGADRVLGYRLPSALTGTESMNLAEDFMRRIGCRLETVSIDGAAAEVLRATAHLDVRNDKAAALAQENLQARLRMIMLMYANNAMSGLLLGTSNRSESSLGYTTIYGDMAGQYNPIKDLYKTDVWNVMRWRNAHIPTDSRCPVANPIPEAIIERAPTAELAVGQTDEASLGSYYTLDPLLKAMIEQQLDPEAARKQAETVAGASIHPAYAIKIAKMIYGAEFKRRQACIGPQIRPNSFGLARRYPITNLYGIDSSLSRPHERQQYEQAQRQPRITAFG